MSKIKKFLIALTIIILLVSIHIFAFGMNFVANLCAEEVRAEVIDIINYSNDYLQSLKIFYGDYFTIHYDNDGKIEGISANTALINQVNMIVQTEIQNRLNRLRTLNISLPMGAFTGSAVLSSFGAKIPINVRVVSNCYTELKSEFQALGINFTLHRLQINCFTEIKVLIPSRSVVKDVTNELLMAEHIIVGEIPSTYLGPNANTDYLDLLPD